MTDQPRTFGAYPADDVLGLDTDDTTTTHTSPLDDLRDELTRPLDAVTVTVTVDQRPGWATVHRLDFTTDEIDRWRKASRSKVHTDGLNPAKFAGLIVAATCTAITKDGTRVVDEEGAPVLIASRDMLDMLNVPDAWQAARKFYGTDGALLGAQTLILERAGYGPDGAAEADPTE